MQLKPYLGLVLTVFLVFATDNARSQASPAASEAKLPLAIGLGVSGFDSDSNNDRLLGGTFWIDYSLNMLPHSLQGLGLEVYGRDLNYDRSQSEPSNLRQDVGGGGVFYSWHKYRNIRPYAKFEMGFGNMDYMNRTLRRVNQTRTVTSLGGGVEFRVMRSVWLRADYEYQNWPDFYKNTKPSGTLNPQGGTLGVMYHFGKPRLR